MKILSTEQIQTLERNGCCAQDWSLIKVSGDFVADSLRDVEFYGECELGATNGTLKNELGIEQRCGIRNARIANSTVGDNCVIENVTGFISNTEIGNECFISNVGTIKTDGKACYGQGRIISVLNEAGDGNIVLCSLLTSQTAAMMTLPDLLNAKKKKALLQLAENDVREFLGDTPRTTIGNNVVIRNTQEISNSFVGDDTVVNGARSINECTFISYPDAKVVIGNGVILDGCIATFGSHITNNVIARNCFVGECSTLTDGFSATDSVFFANSFMANGETCASFCGPFTVSHHKSTLLIGGMYSFYNAGSGTNFSNHAYKMGPIHWGIMERGAKTASSAHILWPASIGAFNMCMGKISTHPDTRAFPFSYCIGDGQQTWLVPARNIATVGTYRDINKWPVRDARPEMLRFSDVNTDWMHESIAIKVFNGRMALQQMAKGQGDTEIYTAPDGCRIKASALKKGIVLYELYLKMFIAKSIEESDAVITADTVSDKNIDAILKDFSIENYEYVDVSGAMVRKGVLDKVIGSACELGDIDLHADDEEQAPDCRLAFWIAAKCFYLRELSPEQRVKFIEECHDAHARWIEMIKQDAQKEYNMGDVEEVTLKEFIEKIS